MSTASDAELMADERLAEILPGMLAAGRAFLRACAAGDERAIGILLVDVQAQTTVAGLRVDQVLSILGLTSEQCGALETLPGELWLHDDGNGGELALTIDRQEIRLAVVMESGRWRIRLVRKDRLFAGFRHRQRRCPKTIHVPIDD